MILSLNLHLADSLRFTKEALTGNWIRGSIFLLLCLCQGLLLSSHLLSGGISRRINPWWELTIGLTIISLIMFGYCIRIFKGNVIPPSFFPLGSLIKDGVLALIAIIIWWIPSVICIIILYGISHLLIFYWISMLWLIVSLLVSPVIYFRYANTGNFFESIRFSNVLSTIRTLGWWTYLAACGIWMVSLLVLAAISIFLNSIFVHILPNQIAPPLSAIGGFFVPILYVFLSRLFTNILTTPAADVNGNAKTP